MKLAEGDLPLWLGGAAISAIALGQMAVILDALAMPHPSWTFSVRWAVAAEMVQGAGGLGIALTGLSRGAIIPASQRSRLAGEIGHVDRETGIRYPPGAGPGLEPEDGEGCRNGSTFARWSLSRRCDGGRLRVQAGLPERPKCATQPPEMAGHCCSADRNEA
jgi:hypothetical protein